MTGQATNSIDTPDQCDYLAKKSIDRGFQEKIKNFKGQNQTYHYKFQT